MSPLSIESGDSQEIIVLSGKGSDENSSLKIFSADASGTLNLSADILLETPARALQVADGDGDNITDLVFTDYEGRLIYLKNFSPPLRLIETNGLTPTKSFALSDFDDNGSLDGVFCSTRGLSYTSDLLGDSPASKFRISSNDCDVVKSVDLDKDGLLDLLVASIEENIESNLVQMRPWIRDGSPGWFQGGAQSFPLTFTASIQSANLDGNGTPDILINDISSSTKALQSSLGLTLVEFLGPRLDVAFRLRFGDINGDGSTDIIGFGLSGGISIALADNDGGFLPLLSWDNQNAFGDPSTEIRELVAADFDGNGVDELIVLTSSASQEADGLIRLTLSPDPSLDRETIASVPPLRLTIHPTDLNADGHMDLLMLNAGSHLTALLLLGDGNGGFSSLKTSFAKTPVPIRDATIYDMDNDGRIDVLSATDNGAFVFSGLDGGSFSPARQWTTLVGQTNLPGDFDADGRADLAVLDGGDLKLALSATPSDETKAILSGLSSIGKGDLDGDGRSELIAAGVVPGGSQSKTLLYLSRGDKSSVNFSQFDLSLFSAKELVVDDFDGDGDKDILGVDSDGVFVIRMGL